MITPAMCPDENDLLRFARGGREDELPAMEAHLDACEPCRRAVAAAASETTLPATVASTELTPGMRVSRYEIERELGRGGMGVVYLARDVTLDRRVALKLLHARHEEAAQARLLREAQVMARLAHPNVVPVFELGDWRGELYLTMELVNGQTLDAWLKAEPRREDSILQKFIEAGQGLAAAHAAGVVHRDFKPANVLVGHDGRVRVTDFGLSRPGPAVALAPMASPLITREGALVGTLAYMAPEQLDGQAADERSDQFSFCVALAEALFGARPFEGENWASLARAHAQRPRLGGRMTSHVRRVLQRGLARAPADRFTSMAALLKALQVKPATGRWLAIAAMFAVGAFAARSMVTAAKSVRSVITVNADLSAGTVINPDLLVQRLKLTGDEDAVAPDALAFVSGQRLMTALHKGDSLRWSQFETVNLEVPVLVAADDLAEGTIITRSLLTERKIDPSLATRSVIRPESATTILGARVRVPAEKGALMLWTQFEPTVAEAAQRVFDFNTSKRTAPLDPGEQTVLDVVSSHNADFAACAEAAWAAVQPTPGKVVLGWKINTDGTVSNVRTLGAELTGDSTLGRCLVEQVSRFRFSRRAEPADIEFPLTFKTQW